jgi:autotransporter-associated beta strand protein
MNHTYRLVWNRRLSMFVALSECARASGKASGGKSRAVAALVIAAASAPALAFDPADTIAAGQTVAVGTLAPWGNVAFQGGTLQLDAAHPVLSQDFTINAQNGVIDQHGAGAIAFGSFTDAVPGVPGSLSVVNSGAGGTFQLTGALDYTGTTTIGAGAIVAVSGSASLEHSRVIDNGVFNISAKASGASIAGLTGAGTVELGANQLSLRTAAGTFSGTLNGTGGLTVNSGSQTLTAFQPYRGATIVDAGAQLILSGLGRINASSGVTVNGTVSLGSLTVSSTVFRSLDGNGRVDLGTTDLYLGQPTGTFNGTITGSAGLAVNGGTETFTAAQAYTGVTAVTSSGTLALSGKGSIASSSGAQVEGVLDLSATTSPVVLATLSGSGSVVTGKDLSLTAAADRFDGVISGSGGLIVASGAETLNGQNTFSGFSRVDAGATLSVTGNGSIANAVSMGVNGTLNIAGASGSVSLHALGGSGRVILGANTLVLNEPFFGTFQGAISGTGGLTLNGGIEQLAGANNYTGATRIDNGILTLTGGGTLRNSSGVTVNGTLFLNALSAGSTSLKSLDGNGYVDLGNYRLLLTAASGSFGGTILGTGGLIVISGAETLTGVNTNTGPTQIAGGGTLALRNGGSIAGSSVVYDDGVFDISASSADVHITTLAQGGAVVLGANQLVLSNAATTFSGAIAGSGGVAVSGGSATFSGVNSYTGTTRIASGAMLSLSGGGSIASSSGLAVDGQFDIGRAAGDVQLASLSGSGAVSLGANTLALTAATGVFSGTIGGAGALTVNAGNITLGGENSYTGATRIAAGATLALTTTPGLAASSRVIANGTLDISASNGGASVASLAGGGAVTLGDKQLTVTNGADTFAGSIGGSGGLLVTGGVQTLSGVNHYTGPTVINAGAELALVGGGSITSSSGVLDNGTLTVATGVPAVMTSLSGSGTLNLAGQSVTFTQGTDNFTGHITGTGTILVTGGTQQLNGNNTFIGPVGVSNGGVLKVAANAGIGAESNGIILNNGTLDNNSSFTMARPVSITGAGTFQADAGTTLVSNGAVSGSGMLVKTGAGTLVLGGDNSALAGGTAVNAGTLKVQTANALGSGVLHLGGGILEASVNLALAQDVTVAGGAGIAVDTGTTTLMSGAISTAAGTGCFSKSGGGTLTLDGTGAFATGLCVADGIVRANGAVAAGGIQVAAAGVLRGTGTLAGPLTVSGTLAPGNSPGTLSTSANVTMLAASTYQEDINGTGTATGPGNYSRLLVFGAGQFNAGGATLTPNLVNITGADRYTAYVPKVGDSFRIITAAGGLAGRFAPLVQPAGLADGTSLRVFYNGDGTNSIDLRVLPTSYASFSSANGGNMNGQQSGAVLDRVMTADQAGTATAAQSALAYAVSNFAGGSVAKVTQNLSGQVHAAMAAIAPLAGQAVQGTVTRQFDLATPAEVSARSALWADLAGNRAEWDADSHASGFVANRGQLTVGVDAFRNDSNRVGAGFSHARANLDAENGSGTLRENMVFAYGAHQGQVFGVDAMAGAGRTSWDTERANPLGGGALATGMDGRNVLASIGISAPWQADGATFKPFVRVLWQRTERDAGSEGTGLAALSLGEYSASGTRTTAGLSGNTKGGAIGQTPYTMQYSFGVGRDNGSLARSTVDSSLAGIASTIVAPHASRSFVQAAVSGTVLHGASTSSYYGVATELHGNRADVSLSGGLRYAF